MQVGRGSGDAAPSTALTRLVPSLSLLRVRSLQQHGYSTGRAAADPAGRRLWRLAATPILRSFEFVPNVDVANYEARGAGQ